MRGPIVHGVLLAVALGGAWYSVSNPRDESRAEKPIAVWEVAPADVAKVQLETERKRVTVEARKDGDGDYAAVTYQELPVKPKPPADAAKADGGSPDGGAVAAEAPPPAEPEPPPPLPKSFLSTTTARKAIDGLATLRARRALGKLDDAQKQTFGLADASDRVTLTLKGGETRVLTLGGKVFGSGDRYALDGTRGEGWVIAGSVVRDFEFADTSLMERGLHAFEPQKLGRAVLTVGGQKREIVRGSAPGEAAGFWADASTPEQRDEALTTWMSKVERLRALEYLSGDAARAPTDTALRIVFYPAKDSGLTPKADGSIGFLELARGEVPVDPPKDAAKDAAAAKDAPAVETRWLARTEQTRGPVKLAKSAVDAIEQDLQSIVAGGGEKAAGGAEPSGTPAGGAGGAEKAPAAPVP